MVCDLRAPGWLTGSTVADTTDTASAEAEMDLLRRAKAGDEAAFGELVKQHYERVFRRVVAITRNEHDARDLCQDIWVSVWRSLPHYRGEARLTTWLYSIATRRAIDHLRKGQRWFRRFLPFASEPDRPTAEPASPAPSPRDAMELGESDLRVRDAIASLPPKHQAVLALREIEGLSYEQIAETLKCRTGTVMSRLFTARRLLAKKLGDLPCD